MRALIVVLIGLLTLPALAANDRDGDGITDANDRCPDEPEDRDGFQDADGCPDPDNDQDGIVDVTDKCPNEPEDRDGFQDADGCPDPDNDQDGTADVTDKCPNEPEDRDGFQDADGCPDPDNDQDGIPDAADKCPNEPETKNGFQDDDGCPDVASPKANEGTLDIHTTPPAEVTIDGKAVGRTPLSLRVLAGKHQVRLNAGGGRVVIRTITIEAGKKFTLAIEL
jgi:hypothetical protein